MSLDLVAVGGTGQHIALALADLYVLAHSAVPTPWAPVRFILLDADPAAADGTRRSAWEETQLQLAALAAFPPMDGTWPAVLQREPFPRLGNATRSARDAIQELFGRDTADGLLAPRQRDLDVLVGYHGEPWVAAALTERLIQDVIHKRNLRNDDPLIQLLQTLNSAESRVVLAGSAIGGTGAGVLPRLVAHLADRDDRRAKLGAIIGLPWFRLDKPEGKNLNMDANGVACLWHYRRTVEGGGTNPQPGLLNWKYRLMLWGHPMPETANLETHDGSVKQAHKKDLTLPFHAAAAAASFLLGADNSPDVSNGIFAPVTDDDKLHLPEALGLGPMGLGELIARNEDLIGRLRALLWYLDQESPGPVMAWFRSAYRVSSLDGLSASEREALGKRATRLLEAKTSALNRLRAAMTERRPAEPTEVAEGALPLLREHFQGIQSARDLNQFGSRLRAGAPGRSRKSAGRLLPRRATQSAGFVPEPVGAAAPVANMAQLHGLVPFPSVDVTRVPDLTAPELIVREVLSQSSLWTNDHQNEPPTPGRPSLIASLRTGDLPTIPNSIDSIGGDRYPAWMARWFLLSLLVVGGVALVDDHETGHEGRRWRFVRTRGSGTTPGTVLGYVSPDLLVVPTPTGIWDDAVALRALRDALPQVSAGDYRLDRFRTWVRDLRAVGACKHGDAIPDWVNFLGAVLGPRDPGRDEHGYDLSRTLPLRWAGQTVSLPILSNHQHNTCLVRHLCKVFDLGIVALSGQTDLPTEARRAWDEIEAHSVRDVAVLDQNQRPWEVFARRTVVWMDQLGDTTQRYLHCDLFLVAGLRTAYALPDGATPVRFSQLALPFVTTLDGASGPTRLWPVDGRYLALVERVVLEVSGDDSVKATFRLRGRNGTFERECSYTRDEVASIPQGQLNLLWWPRTRLRADGAIQLLVSPDTEAQATSARILFAGAAAGKTYGFSSDWKSHSQHFHHIRPTDHTVRVAESPLQSVRPSYLELRAASPAAWAELRGSAVTGLATTGPVALGVWPVVSETRNPGESIERWCVDLGSSSTVVASYRDPAAESVSVSADRDATLALSLGRAFLRDDLRWLPTWQEGRPSDLGAPMWPTQVVTFGNPGMEYGLDWGLDHGARLQPYYLDHVHDDLKWRSDEQSRAYRAGFLQHLLEHSLEMENARRGAISPLPRRLPVCFTLPVRQRARLQGFSQEVTEIAARVRAATGIELLPSFLWESEAVAPRIRKADGMVVVADLGGGTLDLWAQNHHKGDITARAAESAYVGGRAAVDLVVAHRKGAELREVKVSSERKALDQSERRQIAERAADYAGRTALMRETPGLHTYFQIVCRLVVAWSEAVRQRWNVTVDAEHPIEVIPVGLGWSMAAGDRDEVLDYLNRAAADLSLNLHFSHGEGQDPGAQDPRGRKTWLARQAAELGRGGTVAELQAQLGTGAGALEAVVGIDLTVGGAEVSASELLSRNELQNSATAILVDERLARLVASDPTLISVASVAEQLKQVESGNERSLGCRHSGTKRLVVSPLAVVAELAVQRLRARHTADLPS